MELEKREVIGIFNSFNRLLSFLFFSFNFSSLFIISSAALILSFYDSGEILKLNPSYKAPPDYKPLLKESSVPLPVSVDSDLPLHMAFNLPFLCAITAVMKNYTQNLLMGYL